jgi:hypothetical protein
MTNPEEENAWEDLCKMCNKRKIGKSRGDDDDYGAVLKKMARVIFKSKCKET